MGPSFATAGAPAVGRGSPRWEGPALQPSPPGRPRLRLWFVTNVGVAVLLVLAVLLPPSGARLAAVVGGAGSTWTSTAMPEELRPVAAGVWELLHAPQNSGKIPSITTFQYRGYSTQGTETTLFFVQGDASPFEVTFDSKSDILVARVTGDAPAGLLDAIDGEIIQVSSTDTDAAATGSFIPGTVTLEPSEDEPGLVLRFDFFWAGALGAGGGHVCEVTVGSFEKTIPLPTPDVEGNRGGVVIVEMPPQDGPSVPQVQC